MSDEGGFGGHGEQTDLARDLSLFDITMIGVAGMISAGFFVLSAIAAGEAGPALMLAFALNGVITIFTGMVYAELGSAIPEAGGGYLWVREALGRSQAFLAGWMSWFAHAVAGSLYALGFGSFITLLLVDYFGVGLFGLDVTMVNKLFAVLAGVVFTYINYRGAKETGLAGNVVTVIKVSAVLVFILFGLGIVFGSQPTSHTVKSFTPFMPNGFYGILVAMGLTVVAFEGYEIIVQSGEEVVNPKKSVPKAVFYALALVVTVYIGAAVVLIGVVEPVEELIQLAKQGTAGGHGITPPPLPAEPTIWQVLGHLGELGLARAASQVMPYGTLVILVAGIFASLASLNSTTYSSTRVAFAMGRDQVLPDLFNAIHPDKHTPYLSAVASGVLIIIMAVTLPIGTVAVATDMMFILLFLQVNYAAIKLRREHGDELDYGYVTPWFPVIPVLGIISMATLAVVLASFAWFAVVGALAWILAGLVIFFIYSRGRVRETAIELETRLVTEERDVSDRGYQVLLPIANPDFAEQLIQAGSAIARRNDGELLLTSVATVPEQTPLNDAYIDTEQQRELLTEAMEYVPDDIPAHRTVTIGHDVGKSISNIAYQRDSEMILLGWRGQRKRRSDIVFGSIIDRVVEHAPTNVSVMKTDGVQEADDILVPTAGGPHAELAEDVAAGYAASDANVTLFTVATDGTDDGESMLEERKQSLAEDEIDVSTAVTEGTDITDTILAYARDHEMDTIIIGATNEGLLRRALFGEIPEHVGDEFDGQVIMVKKHQPVQSAVRHFIQKWVGRGAKSNVE